MMPAEESVQLERWYSMRVRPGTFFLLLAPEGVDDPNVGQVHDGKTCAPHRPTPVGLLERRSNPREAARTRSITSGARRNAPRTASTSRGPAIRRRFDGKRAGSSSRTGLAGPVPSAVEARCGSSFADRPSGVKQLHAPDGSHHWGSRRGSRRASQHGAALRVHVAVELNNATRPFARRNGRCCAPPRSRDSRAMRSRRTTGRACRAASAMPSSLPLSTSQTSQSIVTPSGVALNQPSRACPTSPLGVAASAAGPRALRALRSATAAGTRSACGGSAQEFTGDEPLSRQARQQNRASSRECSSRERRSRVGSRARLAAKRGQRGLDHALGRESLRLTMVDRARAPVGTTVRPRTAPSRVRG